MGFSVQVSRLLRKRPLDVHQATPAAPYSPTLFSAACRTANSPLIIGYLIAFSYSALLAPSTLPGVIFLASIASLLSELCKYEFLTCQRNTSTCTYICVYQLLGELPAYIYGWLQFANRAAMVALLARCFGSILVLIIGNGLARHHYLPSSLVHEDALGITAQLLVMLFVLGGLNLTVFLTAMVKGITLTTLMLFVSVLTYFSSDNDLHPKNVKLSHDEQFLLSAALITMAFKPENKEPKLQTGSTMVSVYLGVNHCVNLLVLVVMSVLFCILPISVLTNQKSSAPLLEILMHVSQGPHWFVVTFACGCIFAVSLSLVEAVQDGRRHVITMANDGLLCKQLVRFSQLSVVVFSLLSLFLELIMSTFALICIVAFIHLSLDASLGLVVAYRRYCTALPYATELPNRWRNIHRRLKGYERPLANGSPRDSDSDDTDIDAAVDEYKTQVYVSTVMTWNGSEILNRRNPFREENGAKTSFKIKALLLVAAILILIMATTMRWVGNMKAFAITVTVISFVLFLTILLVIWLHPQKMRPGGPTFKVPCVPWIPVGSTLFHSVLLFQLPALTWLSVLIWLTAGMIFYLLYGYRRSRLNFKQTRVNGPIDLNNKKSQPTQNETLLRMPGALLDMNASSIAVYPQPYHHLA